MKTVSSNLDNWSNLFVLAHEVGHHVNGHTKDAQLYVDGKISSDSKYKNRQQELEADEWAGFIISRLGANESSWKNVRKLISAISSSGDDSNSTHPNRNKRLVAAQTGYNKGRRFIQNNKSSINYKTPITRKKASNIYLPIKRYLNSPRSFWFKEKRFQSFGVFSLGGFKEAEVGLLNNGGGLLKFVPYGGKYINGTISIYLSNGKIIKCFDKGFKEIINYDRVSYYYLTKNEMKDLFDPRISVDEIRVKEGNSYRSRKKPLSKFNKQLRELRYVLGFFASQTSSPNEYKNSTKITSKDTANESINTPKWDYNTMGPKRSDYTSSYDYLVAKNKWIDKKNYNSQSTINQSTNYKSKLDYKTLNKRSYRDYGLTVGLGYLEGVVLNFEYYFGSWSLGFRPTIYNENSVVNWQGVAGLKLIEWIYLKAAIGNANNFDASMIDLDLPYEDYTSYSVGLSFFKNGNKISISPEVFYDFQKKSVGGIISISF